MQRPVRNSVRPPGWGTDRIAPASSLEHLGKRGLTREGVCRDEAAAFHRGFTVDAPFTYWPARDHEIFADDTGVRGWAMALHVGPEL